MSESPRMWCTTCDAYELTTGCDRGGCPRLLEQCHAYHGWFTEAEVRALAEGSVPATVQETMRRAAGLLDGTILPVATDPDWARPRSARRGFRRPSTRQP